MSKPFTIQALPHDHSFRKGCAYALRLNNNVCAAVVGEVDAWTDGETTQRHTRLFANAPDTLHWLKQCEHYFASRELLGPPLTDGEKWLLGNMRTAIMAAECAPLPTV